MRTGKQIWSLWILLAALVLAAALGGCGGPAPEDSGPAKPPENAGETTSPGSIGGAIPPGQEEEKPQLPLGLYINNGSGIRSLAASVEAEYTAGKDIVVLSAFLSAEPEISGGKFARVWNDLRKAVPEAAPCKIGYRLSYELASGETVSQTILAPEDTEENRTYIETYIYDDVHQDGWYSHLLPADMTEQTVATSLKLTGGPEVSQVGEITVEAFLYEEDPLADPAGRWEVTVNRLF